MLLIDISVFWSTHSCLQTEELDGLKERIEAVNQNRPPLKVINGYSILDPLGSGAFGSVFKVKPFFSLVSIL